MQTSQEQRCKDALAFWQTQAAQLERDRTNLKWIGIAGLPATLVATWVKAIAGGAVFLVMAGTYLLGLYMTAVRRAEYEHNIREAETALADATKRPS